MSLESFTTFFTQEWQNPGAAQFKTTPLNGGGKMSCLRPYFGRQLKPLCPALFISVSLWNSSRLRSSHQQQQFRDWAYTFTNALDSATIFWKASSKGSFGSVDFYIASQFLSLSDRTSTTRFWRLDLFPSALFEQRHFISNTSAGKFDRSFPPKR
jgi:hypothetical protein